MSRRIRTLIVLSLAWLALFGITVAVGSVTRSPARASIGAAESGAPSMDADSARAMADLDAQPLKTVATPFGDLFGADPESFSAINSSLTNERQRQRLRGCKALAMPTTAGSVEYFDVSFHLTESEASYRLTNAIVERASLPVSAAAEACIVAAFEEASIPLQTPIGFRIRYRFCFSK